MIRENMNLNARPGVKVNAIPGSCVPIYEHAASFVETSRQSVRDTFSDSICLDQDSGNNFEQFGTISYRVGQRKSNKGRGSTSTGTNSGTVLWQSYRFNVYDRILLIIRSYMEN